MCDAAVSNLSPTRITNISLNMSLMPSDFNDIVTLYPFVPHESVHNPAFIYTCVILESLARETLVEHLWRYVNQRYSSELDQLFIARRLREGLLKASVLVGFPRVE